MKITKVREFIATVFVLLLIVAFAAGVALALGKNIPIVSYLRQKLGF